MKQSEGVADSVPTASGNGSGLERPANAPVPRGRCYPRGPHEVAEAAAVGERRAPVGLAVVPHIYPSMAALEASALADLGDEQSVAALLAESVRLGVWADTIVLLLLDEIMHKAALTRREGRTPHASRYKATAIVGSFMALAGRLFEKAGLERRARDVGQDLRSLWKSSSTKGSRQSDDLLPDDPRVPEPADIARATQPEGGAARSGGGRGGTNSFGDAPDV